MDTPPAPTANSLILFTANEEYAYASNRIETFVVDADWRNWFFVRVKTDEGITGVGEALSGEGLTAALEATAEAHKHYLIGEDPLNRKGISRKLRRYPFAWRAGN